MTMQAIAVNRFGLGARPADSGIDDPKGWLLRQLSGYAPVLPGSDQLESRAEIATAYAHYVEQRREARMSNGAQPADQQQAPQRRRRRMMQGTDTAQPAAPIRPTVAMQAMNDGVMADTADTGADAQEGAAKAYRQGVRANYIAQVAARTHNAVLTDTPFVERLVHFWANHFAVSIDKQAVAGLAGWMEFEAVRPHVLGRFSDMLVAVEQHPAMLLYLDQAQSIGPASPFGQRAAARAAGQGRIIGLNENLGREIMELHTLGVRTGYDQADVTELARALTGWTVAGLGRPALRRIIDPADHAPGDFAFAAAMHEPGTRTIMGKSYAEQGEGQGRAILHALAVHPATARHIATKLARHFVADDPPLTLVTRLEQQFLATGGDLPSVYRALINAPEAWEERAGKFRTPWDWSIAAFRALHRDTPNTASNTQDTKPQGRAIVGMYAELGEPVWKPGSPAGFDDVAASWAGPDALLRRVEAAERIASQTGAAVDPHALAQAIFPGGISPASMQAIARADSPGQGLALLLVSPEMMRR